MSATGSTPMQDAPVGKTRAPIVWERSIRLWSGVVLLTFVTMHLLNHALGIFGLGVLNHVQEWRWNLWHELPGSVILYAAFAAHFVLGLKKIVSRRTWRMCPAILPTSRARSSAVMSRKRLPACV